MANGDLLNLVDHSASENYDYNIERDCADCTSWVKVSAQYNDPWNTRMAGAPFRIWQDGAVIEENTLKSKADLGKQPGDPLTEEERAELGTFTKLDVAPGAIRFELLQQGSEAHVQALEHQCIELTARSVTQVRDHYATQWQQWDEATAAGKAQQVLSEAFGGFMDGVAHWWEEEKGLWDMISGVFAAAWEAIVDTLGDVATALHPDNIGATAQIVWDGARDGAAAVAGFVSEIPDRAKAFYAGTVLLIENMGEIIDFIEAFVTGDWQGVESFVRHTLPKLIEDDTQAAHWAAFINNNAEAWQVVLEIVGYTKGPALIVAACAGVCAAVPPQVWAGFGIASVTVVAIEVAVSAVIGFLASAATVITGGGASVAMGALVVGRSAKWARMGADASAAIRNLLTHVDRIIQRVVTMGQASMRARRHLTTSNGNRNGATGGDTNQRREEEQGGDCLVCNKELGDHNHPARTPDRDGITDRTGSARRTDYGPSGRYSDSGVGSMMKASQGPTHPVNMGVTMTHHHILMISEINGLSWSGRLEKVGYVIHDPGNLVLMPNHKYGACHLEVQSHRSRHTTTTIPSGATTTYKIAIDRAVSPVERKLLNSDFCRGNHTEIQNEMNTKSARLLRRIASFDIQIQSDNDVFRPNAHGCGDCGGLRNHGPGVTLALQSNNPQQSSANAERIVFPKSGQWALEPGR